MAKSSKKRVQPARLKIKNKHQSKKNSSKNKKRYQKRPKNQTVVIQKQTYNQSTFVRDAGDNCIQNGGDHTANDDEGYLDVLGPDATLDDIDYLLNNHGNLSFLSQALDSEEPPGKRKKGNHGNEQIASYEKQPRKLGNLYKESDTGVEDRIQLLPLKGNDGLIQRSMARDDKIEEKQEPIKEGSTTDEVDRYVKQELSIVEIYAEREKTIRVCKSTIASACEELLENPEANLKHLKTLLELCADDQFIVVRKLSMISLSEVFKDIVPGYRIRTLTDTEKSAKVSKDVKKLRGFEENLVMYYKKYLDRLEETVQDFVSKKWKLAKVAREFTISKAMALIAVNCMVDMLSALNHFNYRTNLIVAVVSKVNFVGDRSEVADVCVGALNALFRNDEVGDVSLEAIKVIARMAKANLGKLRPQVLEALLYLNIDAQLIKDAENRESKIERLRWRKEQLKKMSRKERKRKKLETKLNKELEETQAVESKQKIQRNQTEILKFIFVIYFRVLKQERKTTLLTPVLKGLAKYAYLINVDFINDLMTALQRLINSGELSMTESMSCVLTSFKILSGQGDVLNIDPHNFYLHLYNSLVDVAADSRGEDIDLCIECLNLMLVKRRKQVSQRRIQGFLKRMSTVLLQQETEQLISFLILLRSILQLNQKCDALLDNERLGRGVFQPELPDPEHCNADSTALWELSFLDRHYSSEVKQYTKHLSHGAPSQGQYSLSTKLSQRKDFKDLTKPTLEYFFPDSTPSHKQARKTPYYEEKWYHSSMEDYVKSVSSTANTRFLFDFAKHLR